MQNKNLKFNMAINAVKGLLSVLFPLISFPYISRVLQVENIGAYNFSNSIISYFVLIAGLGIQTYATCEGAKVRDIPEKIDRFSSELFSINLISTLVAYALLVMCVCFSKKLQEYTALLTILSAQIALSTFGREWICSIFEDFLYLSIRYIVCQICSIVALFLFVHDENDLMIYVAIVVLSSAGANIVGYFRTQRFCKIRVVFKSCLTVHLKPVLMFFATTIAVTIYVNSDITILGFLATDYEVGIYSVSVKIYTIVKTVLSAAIAAAIPRLAALSMKADSGEYVETAKDTYELVLSFALPALVGISILSDEIVWIISGSAYAEAAVSLRILSIALLFCMIGYFWGQCVLYPFGKAKIVLVGTVVSAVINVFLNLILIPMHQEKAAAFTTVVSEAFSALMFFYYGRKHICIPHIGTVLLKIVVGCVGIIILDLIANLLIQTTYLYVLFVIFVSVIAYVIIETKLNNKAISSIIDSVVQKIRNK